MNPRIRAARLGRHRTGSFVVIFAMMNTVLFAFAALAVDVSYVRSLFGEMQRTADASSHAMMTAITHRGTSTQGLALAQAMGQQNLVGGQPVSLSSSNFSFGVWSFTTHSFATAAHSNAVRLDYSAPISLLFGPLIGRATSTGKVRSTVAMRPRELVFVVDVSTGSQATSRASAYTGMLSEINGYGFQDDEVAMVVYDSGLVGSHATLQSVVNNYTALNSRWSHMNSCGNGGMPACVDASDPAVGINEAVSILQNQGDNRFYQAIYLVTPGNVRCTSGTSSCATNLQNSAVTAVDAAWALGISVYPIAVQPTVSQATFLSTLSRGDGLKTGLQQTSTISDLDYYLDLVADHYPLTIVE